jgi:hypothetical protein
VPDGGEKVREAECAPSSQLMKRSHPQYENGKRSAPCFDAAPFAAHRITGRDMPGSVPFRRDDLLAQALGLLDVKSRLRLMIFLKGAFDRSKRIVEIMWLAGFVEQNSVN